MILKGNFNNICVCIIRKQSYMTHLGTKSTSSSNSVEVSVCILGHVVVEYNVDTLNVHTTAKQVGGHQDTLLEILELLVPTKKSIIYMTLKFYVSKQLYFRKAVARYNRPLKTES